MRGSLRAILFVPANRPDRIPKALASGADLVCVDLEDAILTKEKASARYTLLTFLRTAAYDRRRLSVRINDPRTVLGQEDVAAIADSRVPVETLVVPKATTRDTLDEAVALLPKTERLVVLVETAEGLSNAFDLAQHSHVHAMVFGSADWSTEIGCRMAWEPLLYARSRIIHAAVEAGVVPMDGAWLDLNDLSGLEEESRRLSELGFRGRIALHPRQVPVILKSFSEDDASIQYAIQLLDAADRARAGTFQMNGQIVDEPMLKQARQLLQSLGIKHPAGKDI